MTATVKVVAAKVMGVVVMTQAEADGILASHLLAI